MFLVRLKDEWPPTSMALLLFMMSFIKLSGNGDSVAFKVKLSLLFYHNAEPTIFLE